ncbi:hypothetical protein [Snodgrassella alvi]|uniref:hypothetical protein n=1 Tax=Snodgrassella alvi TaxID=1196083 RepID=UPI000C1E1D9F|nr:hypothetical protein BHC51_07715 [Snodgrassella alvi]
MVKEYDLTPSALDRWINQSSKSGSFKSKDNRTPEQNELIALRNELKQLRKEIISYLSNVYFENISIESHFDRKTNLIISEHFF